MLYPVQQALTKLRFDVGVCRICDNIVQLPRVFLHIIEEVVRIHIRCRSLAAIDTGGIDRVHIICRADAAAAAALRDLGVDLISSIMIFLFHNVKQIFADHLVADIHACQSQQSLGDALGADQLGDFLAALERAAADDQRHMQAAVVARALIVIVSVQMGVAVAGLEMRAMVGSVKDNSILIQTLFFQFFHQLAEVLVEACALSQIIRILFCCIAAQSLQVFGEDKIRKSLLRAVGAFVVVVVILMVRLNLGYGHEEGLFAGVLVEVVQRELVDAVSTVATADVLVSMWIYGEEQCAAITKAKKMGIEILMAQPTDRERDVNENALQYIIDWILSNKEQFTEYAKGAKYGFEKMGKYYIIPSVLSEALKRVGYTKTKTLRFLYEKGIISKDEKNGGYTVLEYMDTKRSRFIEFDFEKAMNINQNLDDEFVPIDTDDDLPF